MCKVTKVIPVCRCGYSFPPRWTGQTTCWPAAFRGGGFSDCGKVNEEQSNPERECDRCRAEREERERQRKERERRDRERYRSRYRY